MTSTQTYLLTHDQRIQWARAILYKELRDMDPAWLAMKTVEDCTVDDLRSIEVELDTMLASIRNLIKS